MIIMSDSPIQIPYINLSAQWQEERSELLPIIDKVLGSGQHVGGDEVDKFENSVAGLCHVKYAIALNSGTDALTMAMHLLGIGHGYEVITPPNSFIASTAVVMHLGAKPVFVDVLPNQNIDPTKIEAAISEKTKAIMPVHLNGRVCDMDPIMEIAEKHGLKVIEDVSHAQGGLYKGRLLGTIGHIGAMSIMSGKSLACGEGGFLVTDDKDLYERAAAFGHYSRTQSIEHPELSPFAGMPLGGYKYRMHQLSSAVGRTQIKRYNERMQEIQRAMNHFWDLLEGVPGIVPHRTPADGDSTMGGWYAAKGIYAPEQLGGLPVARFCEAVTAEAGSFRIMPGANPLMHMHPVLNDADIYGHGKPTRIAHSDRDLRQREGSLPVTESMPERIYSIPWFKHYDEKIIAQYATAFRKVAENAEELL